MMLSVGLLRQIFYHVQAVLKTVHIVKMFFSHAFHQVRHHVSFISCCYFINTYCIFISEYLTWGNFFYKIYPSASYGDAKSQCEADGSFLAIPRSEAENDFIASLFGDTRIWIGINDIEQEGSFVGVDGSEISWTNWMENQPNNDRDEDGVELWTSTGRWNDIDVSFQWKFVCSIHIEGIVFLI